MIGKDDSVLSQIQALCIKLDKHISSKLLVFKQLSNAIVITKGDSEASRYYIRPADSSILSNIQPYKGPSVCLPDNSAIEPSHSGTLPLSSTLSTQAKQATVLPKLKNTSLISIGQLCNGGCKVLLDEERLLAFKDHLVVLEGTQNQEDGLWDIPLPQTTLQ